MTAASARREAAPKSVGRSTAIFAIWTAVSRVAGLVREIAAAALYGTRGPIAAFVVAFQVPNLLRSLVADAALSAAFVPVFTELEEQGRDREAKRLAGALAGLISLALGAVSLVAIVLAPWVMPLFAPGLSDELTDELVKLSQLLFPIVVLLGLTGLMMGILQAHGEFAATAFVPVLWNVVILGALLGIAPFVDGDTKIYVYAVGILVGTVVQLLYLVPGLRGKGPFPLSIGRGNPHIRRVLALMLPVTIGLGLINVNAVVNTFFASRVSDESVRAIDAAFRLYILPQGIFSVAVSTVLFPAISRMAAREERTEFRRTVVGGLRQIFFLLVPATVFLMVLAEPVVRIVFEHGEFDQGGTVLTGEALFYYTLGLVFNGASLLLIRAFFSLKRPWQSTWIALGTMLLNLVLVMVLYRPMGTGGIPLATSIASLASFVALAGCLRLLTGGLDVRRLADGLVRTLVASAFLGVMAWTSWRLLDDALGRSLGAQIVSMGVAFAAGAIGYLAACQGLEVPELRALGRSSRPLR